MIAVLIDARMPGSSGWVAVRHARKIKAAGMTDGSLVQVELRGGGYDSEVLQAMNEDRSFDIPEGTNSVRAEILKVGEGSRISIDLE